MFPQPSKNYIYQKEKIGGMGPYLVGGVVGMIVVVRGGGVRVGGMSPVVGHGVLRSMSLFAHHSRVPPFPHSLDES